MAVERLKACDNIVAPRRELGMDRRLLYKCEGPLTATASRISTAAHALTDCCFRQPFELVMIDVRSQLRFYWMRGETQCFILLRIEVQAKFKGNRP